MGEMGALGGGIKGDFSGKKKNKKTLFSALPGIPKKKIFPVGPFKKKKPKGALGARNPGPPPNFFFIFLKATKKKPTLKKKKNDF